ncbi:MAG: polysaccharide deacetylase family protein [Bacilli bacterium]|nr:polysaccharide deacetylase family protein [Bacilli bacterium]
MKKKIIISLFILILIILMSVVGVLIYKNKVIKDNFSEYVTTTKKQEIYEYKNSKFNKIGTVNKDIQLKLEKINKQYYKIEGYDYYIYYKNIKETEKTELEKKYYSVKSIVTKPTILYKDNKEVINIDKKNIFELLYIEDGNYYVEFMNDIYYIKDNYEILDSEKDRLESISFVEFNDNITKDNLKIYLDYLKENKYTTILLDEFISWKNNSIDLNKNSILLIYLGADEEVINLFDEYGYKYNTQEEVNEYNITEDIYKIKRSDKNYYKYVVYNNTNIDQFKDAINGIKDSSNQRIAVLNYHFFYEEAGICNESICLDMDSFRKQLQYLNDNNYKTLTIDEFVDWYYGRISLPEKSVLLTIDDGAYGTGAHNGNFLIKALEEYKEHATLFLITAWWDIENYRSEYLDVQSHGYDIHFSSPSCGYQINCLNKEELKADFQKSIDIVQSTQSFCFPFYTYNSRAMEVLEELDFKVAFVGGNTKASRNNNKYKIPRYVIFDNITMNEFINMIN